MNDFLIMIGRSLKGYLRQPAAIIPSFAISVFFLFVYNSGLGSVSQLPGFKGSYLAFIIPVSIASGAVGGAGLAGQALIRDIESGYFTKLLLTPTRRLAIIWGPMVAGAVILVAQVLLILVLGLFSASTRRPGSSVWRSSWATRSSGGWRSPASRCSSPCARGTLPRRRARR